MVRATSGAGRDHCMTAVLFKCWINRTQYFEQTLCIDSLILWTLGNPLSPPLNLCHPEIFRLLFIHRSYLAVLFHCYDSVFGFYFSWILVFDVSFRNCLRMLFVHFVLIWHKLFNCLFGIFHFGESEWDREWEHRFSWNMNEAIHFFLILLRSFVRSFASTLPSNKDIFHKVFRSNRKSLDKNVIRF